MGIFAKKMTFVMELHNRRKVKKCLVLIVYVRFLWGDVPERAQIRSDRILPIVSAFLANI